MMRKFLLWWLALAFAVVGLLVFYAMGADAGAVPVGLALVWGGPLVLAIVAAGRRREEPPPVPVQGEGKKPRDWRLIGYRVGVPLALLTLGLFIYSLRASKEDWPNLPKVMENKRKAPSGPRSVEPRKMTTEEFAAMRVVRWERGQLNGNRGIRVWLYNQNDHPVELWAILVKWGDEERTFLLSRECILPFQEGSEFISIADLPANGNLEIKLRGAALYEVSWDYFK